MSKPLSYDPAGRVMYLYGDVDFDQKMTGFIQEVLSEAGPGPLTVRVNSDGGSVTNGIAIANLLSQRGGFTAIVDGLAASIMSYIVCCADRLVMAPDSWLMIHRPMGGSYGRSEEMRRQADLLDKMEEQIVSRYVKKSGQPEDEIRSMMAEETWISAEDALRLGFADELLGQQAQPVPDLQFVARRLRMKAAAQLERFRV
jgi:ATP-dependent Clp endopeptidase proteolytic subunit ClpP